MDLPFARLVLRSLACILRRILGRPGKRRPEHPWGPRWMSVAESPRNEMPSSRRLSRGSSMVQRVPGRWRSAVIAGPCAGAIIALCGCDSAPIPPPIPTDPAKIATGFPGETLGWTPANKDGFGTAKKWDSKVWFTLAHGELTEIFYPDLGTPAVRDVQFIVTDGSTFVEKEHVTEKGFGEATENRIPYTLDDATEHRVEMPDPKSLTFRQINTAKSGKYRITKTYVTDPERSTVLVNVRFESLTDHPLGLYLLYDPGLSNNGNNDSGLSKDGVLWAFDDKAASAVMAWPAFEKVSSGYLGTSDGWKDLGEDKVMDWSYVYAPTGNVVQLAKTALDGKSAQTMTVAIGFARGTTEASRTAFESLEEGFEDIAEDYAATWHRYLETLKTPNSVVASESLRKLYDVSLMVLAAGEDKLHGGAFIAAPAMPWLWGRPPPWTTESDAYHLVWPRDVYQIA